MKQILVLLLLTVSAANVHAAAPTLRDHMRAMGYMLDEINARSNEQLSYAEAAGKTRELRRSLVASIAMDPPKFGTLNESQRNAARIEYHQLMARVIYLSATLEKTLDAGNDLETQSGTRREDVRNILHEINVLVGKAHRMFRD